MGQKTNPIGFRLGISRKWSTSWFKTSFKHQESQDSTFFGVNNISKGIVTARGGFTVSPFEDFVHNIFRRYVFRKTTKTKKYIPVQIQRIKGLNNLIYMILFYVKMKKK